MSRTESNILVYLLLLLFSGVILLSTASCSYYPKLIYDIFLGVFSAILLLLILEVRELRRDKYIYGQLTGKYKRVDIYNVDNTKSSDTKYISMNEQYKNIDPYIELEYHGNRQYTFEAHYEEGKVKSTLFLDATNPKEGNGHYQYISRQKNHILLDIGYYKMQVDIRNPKRLLLFYKNLVPSGLSEGYEILERQY